MVTPDLLPFSDVVTVKIVDPNQNVIAQMVDVRLDKGMHFY